MEFEYKQVAQAGPGGQFRRPESPPLPRKEIWPRELQLWEAALLSAVTQLWGSG